MTPSTLVIRLFGPLEARQNDTSLAGLHLREGERLLAYLVLRQGTPLSYRQLAQVFFPSEARQNEDFDGGDFPSTRQALYALRRALGEHAWRLVSEGKGIVRFDVSGADVDVVAFEQWVQGERADAWQQAQQVYRGALLEGWNDPWLQDARTRYQRSFERISTALSLQRPVRASSLPSSSLPSGRAGENAKGGADSALLVETDGGAVPLHSPYYVERTTDVAFHQALARQDSLVLVKGVRQIGKTSLLARGLQQARQNGARVLLTDFQSLPQDALVSVETLYRALMQEMADQLDLEVSPETLWNAQRNANRNLERFVCNVALDTQDRTLVWGLDEVDRLFTCSFGSEVFGLFRSWHNRRALDPTGPWSRLTLAMTYATEAHLFIQDINQSPFNVGTRLALMDFTREQVAELNRRYHSPLPDAISLQRLYTLLQGHPYLTRRAFSELTLGGLDMGALEAQADRSDGPFGEHLRRLLAVLQRSAELTECVRGLLRGQPCPSAEMFYRLRSAGVLAGDMLEDSEWRCPLYATFLKRHLG